MSRRSRNRRSARRASRTSHPRLSGRLLDNRRIIGVDLSSLMLQRPEAWSLYPGRGGTRRHVPLTFGTLPAPVRTRINPRSLHYVETFKAPLSTVLCARRKTRREVIFASGRAGGRHRRPRRTASSSIHC